jgi:hypothetical protein
MPGRGDQRERLSEKRPSRFRLRALFYRKYVCDIRTRAANNDE